ncbi:MAG TPA: flagellar biosynthetic protein FliR [Rhodocyclaceae bacterium]
MIQITSAQLNAWIALFMFPMARTLALMAIAPVFSNAALPANLRLIAGLAIGLGIAPALPPMPEIPAGSWIGLLMLAQQILIGFAMGFVLRLVFAAIDIASDLIGLQMGLPFAVFYDPTGSSQTPVIGEFISLLATLILLAMNGHLLIVSALAESFTLLPVSTQPFAIKGFLALLASAGTMFSMGLLLSLPLVAALLITNLALGVLTRIAPTLNLFAIGFPVTIVTGFIVLMLSLPYLGAAIERLYDRGFAALGVMMRAAAGV